MNNKTNTLVASCLASALGPGHEVEREATFPGFHNHKISAANGRDYPYKADVACRALKLMVEYNGPYHYKASESNCTLNDVHKRRWCRSNEYVQICVNPSVNHNPHIMEAYLRFRLYTQLPGYKLPPRENSVYDRYKFVYDAREGRGTVVANEDRERSPENNEKQRGERLFPTAVVFTHKNAAANDESQNSLERGDDGARGDRGAEEDDNDSELQRDPFVACSSGEPIAAGPEESAEKNKKGGDGKDEGGVRGREKTLKKEEEEGEEEDHRQQDLLVQYLQDHVMQGVKRFFKGNGRKIVADVTLVGTDHVTFTVHYSLTNKRIIDVRCRTEFMPNMKHNIIYVTFWTRFPRVDPMDDTFLFFRYDCMHVPLFLFGKRGDPTYHITSYLACRIFDHSDEACFHWKMANDPYNTRSLFCAITGAKRRKSGTPTTQKRKAPAKRNRRTSVTGV